MTCTNRINHRSLPPGPLVLWQPSTVRASTSVSSTSPCSPSQSIDCRTQQGLTAARGIPIGGRGGQAAQGAQVPGPRRLTLGLFFPGVRPCRTPGKNSPAPRSGRARTLRGPCSTTCTGAAARDLTVIIYIVKVRCGTPRRGIRFALIAADGPISLY